MNLSKTHIIFFFALFLSLSSNAQRGEEGKVYHSIHLGYPFDIFDSPDFGFHLAYNPHTSYTDRISLEAQLSYTRGNFDQDDNSFAHNGGFIETISALAGGRYYFTKEEKKNQIYFNLLIGYSFLTDEELSNDGSVSTTKKQSLIGYSTGLYLRNKQNIIFGLAAETNLAITAKIGWQF